MELSRNPLGRVLILLRWTIAVIAVCASAWACAESIITPAKVHEIRERGMVLMVGTEALIVEDTPETRFWREYKGAKRGDYKVGENVHVRLKTDSDPPILREIADPLSWQFLESVRKTYVKATIEKVDSRFVTAKLADGKSFAYRITEKSEIKLSEKSSPTISDLTSGMVVYIKGRLLPNLDTWIDEITDKAPPVEASSKSSKSTKSTPKGPKPKPLPSSGTVEGKSLADIPTLSMFDMVIGVSAFHISYNSDTKFYFEGKKADHSAVGQARNLRVTYKRDKYGRIVASKVEIFIR